MFEIYPINSNRIEDAAYLFNQYRIFYKMPSHLTAAKAFISERLSKRDSIIFLGYSKEKPVGFIQIYPSFSSMAMLPTWLVNDLFVDSKARRLGCAEKMMVHVQTKAKEMKIFSIKLATANDNHAAKKLYQKLGYQQIVNFESYSKTIHKQTKV